MTTVPAGPRTNERTVRGAPDRRGVSMPRVLSAEWTKLTSVRSNAWLALGTVVAAAGTAHALGLFVRPGDGRSGSWVVTSGFVLAQLGFLVLGALVGAGEYTTGTARTTFATVPRRLPVLAAQVLVTAAAAFAVALVALGASVLATAPARSGDAPALDLSVPGASRALLGFAVACVAVALLGTGLGALLRRPADALVVGVLLTSVGDHVLAANPGLVTDTVRAFLPSSGARLVQDDAALAALDATTLGPRLGAWGGGGVAAAWVVVVLVAAAYRLRRHDVR
ncbi:ABC transporter permease [Cellulomonas sp. URHE0023]|uniref:ABC transporter permease n=1 Tax=Cellulomonas sp. URHE0023 TaxID=1380354 RepID=UPI00048A3E63|nr:ABC transporter permease [Cellulomonas sp. URHE0023]